MTTNNITTTFQKELKLTLKRCTTIISPETNWKFTNLNPKTPHLKGLLKVHKTNMPIRPVVDYSPAPAYKIPKKLTDILKTYIPLTYTFNVRNSAQLIKDISEIPYTPDLQLVFLDISDMYSNVPTSEVEHIICLLCMQQDLDASITEEIIAVTKTVTSQNYYGFDGKTYIQQKGLAMGAPSSSILSEVYLQYIENTEALSILNKPGIEGYFRYVDDILLICNKHIIDINDTVTLFNSLSPILKFSLEVETNNRLNYLDLTVIKDRNGFSYEIYRKPTATDTIIPNDSCHPSEQKMAAIKYFANRINTYGLSNDNKQIEIDTVKQILHNNSYHVSMLDNMMKENGIRKHNIQQSPEHPKPKWAKFTYIGKETRIITKLFRHTQVKVAFTSNNNLLNMLQHSYTDDRNKYTKSGVYQLKCPTCNKIYIGQTGRSFSIRYREHKHDFKYMIHKSKFAQHLLEEDHSFDTMENVMEVIRFANKGRMMDALEKFYIYDATRKGTQINDRLTIQRNPVFEAILRYQQRYRNQ